MHRDIFVFYGFRAIILALRIYYLVGKGRTLREVIRHADTCSSDQSSLQFIFTALLQLLYKSLFLALVLPIINTEP